LFIQAKVGGAVDDESVILAKGALIQNQVNALPGSQAPAGVLRFYSFWPTAQAPLGFQIS